MVHYKPTLAIVVDVAAYPVVVLVNVSNHSVPTVASFALGASARPKVWSRAGAPAPKQHPTGPGAPSRGGGPAAHGRHAIWGG
jgi:hypothetical protein